MLGLSLPLATVIGRRSAGGGVTSLSANPGTATNVAVGAASGAQLYDAGSVVHFIEGKGSPIFLRINVSDDGLDYFMLQAGAYGGDEGISVQRYVGGSYLNDVIGYAGVPVVNGSDTRKLSIDINGVVRVYVAGVLRRTSAAVGDVRHSKVGLATGTGASTAVAYGGDLDLLDVTTASYDASSQRASFTISYYSDVPVKATVSINGGSAVDATITSNPTPGTATVRVTVAGGLEGTKPTFVLKTVATAGGAEIGTQSYSNLLIPAPAKFGSNLPEAIPYSGRRIYANLFQQGYWQRTDNYDSTDFTGILDSKGQPIGLPSGATLRRQIGHSDASGTTLELTWTGGAMTVNPTATEGDTSYGAVSVVDANTRRFTESFAYGNGHTFGALEISALNTGSPPTAIKLFPVGEDKSQIYAPSYITFGSQIHGPARWLDLLGTNGPFYGQTWAGRTTPDMLQRFPNLQVPVEFIIAYCNATGRDCYVPMPAFNADDWYTKFFQALDTGANTTNGVGLNAGLKIYVAYSNEVWNVGFPIKHKLRDEYALRLSTAPLSDGGGGFEQTIAEHAYRHNAMMVLLEAAIPTYATRCVRVVETQTGEYHYQYFKTSGGAHYDAHAQAPYWFAPWTSGDSVSPAVLKAPWMAAALARLDSLKPARDATLADGKRYICYEGGADLLASGMGAADGAAFKRSPEWFDIMYAFFLKWRNDFGDMFPHYLESGGDQSSAANWGLEEYQGSPTNQGLLALLAVQAL